MKKIIFIGFIGLLISYGFRARQSVSCDKTSLSATCKKKLERYKYDRQKFTKIIHKNKAQQLEIEVPVFLGEKYRLVFNTAALSKSIDINVYTKDKDSKGREPIYSAKTFKSGTNEYVFDTPLINKLFIDYDVPSDSTNSNIAECVVFMIGYDLMYK